MRNTISENSNHRNPAIDLIRCVACYGVISVHFLLNNGFYSTVIADSKRLYAMVFFRALFMYCVPLFMMLSGYLLCYKTLSPSYYKKIGKIYFVYVAASLFCVYGYPFLYARFASGLGLPANNLATPKFFPGVLAKILSFTAAPYAWYIEMYLGLFLMVPFLNIIYRNLPFKKQKQWLLLTGMILTALPTIVNIYNFTVPGWWSSPTMLDTNNQLYGLYKIMPEWWTGLYPLTYYYLGCYFREYRIQIKPWKLILLLVCTVIISGSFSLWRSLGLLFQGGPWCSWNSIFNLVVASLLFLVFLNIDYSHMPRWMQSLLSKLSELCLGAYLVSWVFDNLFYPVLATKVPSVGHRLEYYFIIVPLVFVCSMCVSFFIALIYTCIKHVKEYCIRLVKNGWQYPTDPH